MTPRQLMIADLKRSGLTDADARRAKYKPLTAEQVEKKTGNFAAGYLIPYHDAKGKLTDYWRVRYTEEVKGAFGATKKKPLRYTGPRDELPRFYFPAGLDWNALNKDPEEPIVFTEGEKKAEAGCKAGLPTISVPGVWAWRSKKAGVPAIPDFDAIEWKGREVLLAFDNDLMSNPQVIAALNAFAHELTSRGAQPLIKYLPKGPGKIGLDDYLLTRSAEAFIKLRSEPYKESEALYTLNERCAFVESMAAVYDFHAKRFYKTRSELLYAFSDLIYLAPKADDSGFKEMNGADQWLKWKSKRKYFDVTYQPGEDEVVDGKINLWRGWGIEPKKGNVKPFHDLLKFLFASEPDLQEWFIKWLAYPIQNPGKKNLTSVLLHSEAQGVGKSFVGYIMGEIYGDNFAVVDHEAMGSSFNGWAVNKQFILGEEITGGNSRNAADRLKNMITREKIHVNIKYQPEYDLPDYVNYLLTSNHVDALFLERSDRRSVVHNIESEPNEFKWYKRIDKWRDNGGPAHVFYYLLNEVDLSDYDPKEPAPTTAAKEQMIALSKSDLDIAVDTLKENPDAILTGAGHTNTCPFLTTAQLQQFINAYTDGRSTLIAVSKALRRGGFTQRSVLTHKAGTQKLWCVRDFDKWLKKFPKDWGDEFDKQIQVKKF